MKNWLLPLMLLLSMAAQIRAETTPGAYPAPDHPWSTADYGALLERLEKGEAPLPTFADAASRAVAERMVSLENVALATARNTQLPANFRLRELRLTKLAAHNLMVLYLNEALTRTRTRKTYERELARLQILILALAAAVRETTDELLPTLPHDSRYAARVAALKQTKQALGTIFAGLVHSLRETQFYSAASRMEMTEAAARYLPALRPVLSEADRRDFATRIGRQAEATADGKLKSALARLERALAAGP